MAKVDDLPRINTNAPRETLVYLSDDTVIKQPGPYAPPVNVWMDKQRHARDVARDLRAMKNTTYFVPLMLEVSEDGNYVTEERVDGRPLKSSYFEQLSQKDQDIIYRGLANFVNDINQMRPILTQADMLDGIVGGDNRQNMSFNTIIKRLQKYVSPAELEIVTTAKDWFDTVQQNDSSIVFSHGDMNENNIFYDVASQTLSIIDFADAKYENAYYMFNRDLARLGWLDIDRLVRAYNELPRKNPVVVEPNPQIQALRVKLQNFVWSAVPFLQNPKAAAKVRMKIIQDSINDVKKAYDAARTVSQFARGANLLQADNKSRDVSNLAAMQENQK